MTRLFALATLSALIVLSCGDNPSEPGPEPPTPSTLSAEIIAEWFPPDTTAPLGTTCGVSLQWTECPDSSFWAYTLYRSTNPGISEDPSRADSLVAYDSSSATSYADSTVLWDLTYYYALRTTSTDTLSAWSNEVEATVPSQSSIGGPDSLLAIVETCPGPAGICSPPHGEDIYVACLYSDRVLALDLTVMEVTDTVAVGDGPKDVCCTSTRLFVTNSLDGTVSVVRLSDYTVEATVSVGDSPSGICVLPDGETVYACCYGSDAVFCIDGSSYEVVDTVQVGDGPTNVCPLPLGERLYVTNRADGTVSVIRTSDNTVEATLDFPLEPVGVESSPWTAHVYVSDFTENRVYVLRVPENTVEDVVEVGYSPSGLCALPNGNLVYAACYNHSRTYLVDTSDWNVASYLGVGVRPYGVCSTSEGRYVAVSNFSANTVSVFGY